MRTLLGMAGRTGREEKRLQEEVIFELSLQVPSGNFGHAGGEVRTLQTQEAAGATRREAAMKQMVAFQLAGDTNRPGTDTFTWKTCISDVACEPRVSESRQQNLRELAQESAFQNKLHTWIQSWRLTVRRWG